jgi:hypothetical protein
VNPLERAVGEADVDLPEVVLAELARHSLEASDELIVVVLTKRLDERVHRLVTVVALRLEPTDHLLRLHRAPFGLLRQLLDR